MSRKVVAHPTATDDVSRLRRLLGFIEAASIHAPERRWVEMPKPRPVSPPLTFQDMMAVVEDREARRLARRRRHHIGSHPDRWEKAGTVVP